jgi:TMAO reductase system protein TorT
MNGLRRALGAGIVAALALAFGGAAYAQAKRPLIGAALPELQGSFWVSMYYGVEDEAKKQNAELIVVNAGGFDQIAKQVQQIENLVQRKVDVLLVGATNATGVQQAVERAIAAGVPVIGFGSIPQPTDKLLSIVLADHYALGALQAECLAKEMKGQGEVALMSGPPGVNWAQDRVKGFREKLAAVAPNVKIIAEKSTLTGRVEGLKLMEDWLQAYPNVSGVYTAVDDLGAGAIDALVKVRKAGVVKVSSSNLSPIGENYLRKGFLQCESVQQIVLQGRESVRNAVAHIKGQKVEKLVKTPAILVTQENVDKLDYSEIKAPRDFRPR